MVLEALVSPFSAEKHPWEMFFIGLLYSSVAIFISIQIFENMAGLVAVFLTVMAAIPVMYSTIKLEEKKDTLGFSEAVLLKEHSKALASFVFLFLGIMIAFTIWYIFLPIDTVHNLFSIQIDTIKNINSNVTGAVPSYGFFLKVLLNNLRVLLFCILFSFFYGAGAIFILTWNASVISVAIGSFFRTNISTYAGAIGMYKLAGYFHIFSIGLLRYMVHGLPEILAYFIGGLAGGIISVAVIRHDLGAKNFNRIVFDTGGLVLISVALLVIAALCEAYVTPLLF